MVEQYSSSAATEADVFGRIGIYWEAAANRSIVGRQSMITFMVRSVA